jgi:hypothetical protein
MKPIKVIKFSLRIKYFKKRLKIFKSVLNSFSLVKEKLFFSNFTYKKKKIVKGTQNNAFSIKIYKRVKNIIKTSELFLYDSFFLTEKRLFNFSLSLNKKKTLVDLLEFNILMKKKKILKYIDFSKKKNSKQFSSTSYPISKIKGIEKKKNLCKSRLILGKIEKNIFSYIKIETNFFLYFRKLMIRQNNKILTFLLKSFKKKVIEKFNKPFNKKT